MSLEASSVRDPALDIRMYGMRSTYTVDTQALECKDAGVPLVQIPQSVIYELTNGRCQDDANRLRAETAYNNNGYLIDSIGGVIELSNTQTQAIEPSSTLLSELTSKLEDLNSQIEAARSNVQKLLADMQDLQNTYITNLACCAIKQNDLHPITLDSTTMLAMTIIEINQLEKINKFYKTGITGLSIPAITDDFKFAIETIKQELAVNAATILAITNERADVQAKLITEQSKFMTTQPKQPTQKAQPTQP